ncbi:Wzt carbohydrate-binding domain-containing protein [Methylobacter psychrophilus]|uniref:Wzt carbohydrate-binding domain-containing protein n=1 Tax=Methylobacter psychrophilus TaxID=96941 RepID=UPI0021D4F158|nr:Wzt carbohydrate-binding domain-containing protein [Methylobacter psychrophilus]
MRTIDKPFPGRIIFDHIPKTAGQATNAWLMDKLGSGCVTTNLSGNHLDMIRQYGGLYSVICGHVHFNDGERLDSLYQYMTCLRDPIDRVISWLYFVINNYDNLQIPELRMMVRSFLDSDGQDFSDGLIVHISNANVEHFCRINGTGLELDDEKVANALAAIKQYDVVGLYEDMPQFFAHVAALIGLPPPQEIARVNVTNQRPQVEQLSPALRERIVELNQLDLRLYAEVVAWKQSLEKNKSIQTLPLTESKWKKYELIRDRVLVTPDLVILTAELREGYDICHGQLMSFDVDFFLAREVEDLEMGIHIFDSQRQWVFGINSTLLGQSHLSIPSGSYRVSHHLVADLPAGKYTAGFAFAERLPEGGQRELAWRDVMCEFQVYHQVSKTFAGTSYLPAEISLYPSRLAQAEKVVIHPVGCLECVTSVQSMTPGELVGIDVTIVNRSEQNWVGDSIRPVNLSYHWLNASGETVIYDGLRTPLATGGVAPGKALDTKMQVVAPDEVGTYSLVLTLVQELVGWFEDKGFEAARLTVEVIPSLSDGNLYV